jgi:hypothetical protein
MIFPSGDNVKAACVASKPIPLCLLLDMAVIVLSLVEYE